jgi:methylated-DNA-protein-cysteine methyltransferase related protein
MTAPGIFLFPTAIRCTLFRQVPEISVHRIYSVKHGCGIFLLFFFLWTPRMTCKFPKSLAAGTLETVLPGNGLEMSWDHVFRFVQRIPRGRVLTYGALAKALRLPGGARTAGRAMAATPSGKGIPWHRVLGARGKLLIREPYSSLQRKLLESEGVTLIESRVDLKRHLWKPPAKRALKQKAPRKRIQK